MFPGHVPIFVCMWNVDHNSRHWEKDTGFGDEMFLQTPRYLIQRSHNQWWHENQNWKRHRAVWRRPDFSEKMQTEVVRSRHKIIWTGQDYPTGNSTRKETKRQREETMGRQHQRMDWEWNSILWKAENREEWRELVVKSTVVPQWSARLRDRCRWRFCMGTSKNFWMVI